MSIEMADKLTEYWLKVAIGAAQGIDWVNETRSQSQRLDNEAESLILDLRRLRNTAKRLGAVSSRPMTTGFFGLSQAGKSYLISALAAGENGKLETIFDGNPLDFIKHINPPGGGKEATGLVTRFSRTAKGGIKDFPLELRLFSEVEIAKILLNSYFNDFDKERVEYQCDGQKVSEILKRAQAKITASTVAGVSADDVVDLQDYAMDNFGKSLSALQGRYWAKATALAPQLTLEDRAILFSLLWGEVPELTATYIMFAKSLQQLGHPERVYAPLSAVVKEQNGIFSQADSIMNVDMLERIGSERDEQIFVRPAFGEGNDEQSCGEAVEISLAQLAALTAELVFPLINKTRVDAFEKVDLLDFPGYRGRLAISALSDVKEGNPVPQLILRGKVAYLFERYTDSQEMNILIVCTPSDKQSDVNSVGPVLERWIKKTQGENAEQRALRKPGLLWAITMFDKRISADLGKDEAIFKISWGKGGLLQQTILERFGSYDWFNNWANNQPFNNLFLVRKPGFKTAFIDADNDIENGIVARELGQLDLMRRTFVDDPDIQKHIAEPSQAWDAMMLLNDGGMKRISDYLQTVALPEVKLQRIGEQLNQAINHISLRFDHWYQSDGAEEIAKKRQIAQQFLGEMQKRMVLLGELLRSLQLPQETIRALYLDNDDSQYVEQQTENQQSVGFADVDLGFGSFDLFGESSTEQEMVSATIDSPVVQSPFAQNVFRAWIEYLRNLSSDSHFLSFYQLQPQLIDDFVGELITAATRLKLQQKITDIVIENDRTGVKRDQLVERQVFTVNLLIADFIAWLGILDKEVDLRPMSRAKADAKVFDFCPPVFHNDLPRLSEQSQMYSADYMKDWFVTFAQLCEQNAGHSAGREIDASQNAKLGSVLQQFTQAKLV
ncbi:hypothetical protein A4G19_03910 [Pasteurellaceae bacterium Macca]|nr:hypothetical protein [Pasteurellaceae bacterium Macca]